MNNLPRSLTLEGEFPHRAEVLSAVAGGASVRKDDRTLLAKDLLGTYTIRLRLAQGRGTATQIADLTYLVAKLREHTEEAADVWYVHRQDGVKFHVFECNKGGMALGCLKGNFSVA
jgi:hypothetical protein